MTAALLIALLAVQPQPQSAPLLEGGYAAAGGDASLSCDQLAAELMVAVGGVMGNAGEQIGIGQQQQAQIAADDAAGQVLGMAGGVLPNAVQAIIAGVEHRRREGRAQEQQAGAVRQQVLMIEQEVRIDRLQRLHELHEQRCAGSR